MGAWGTDVFENDEACDFAADVAAESSAARGLERLRQALDAVLAGGDDLVEAPVATEALAAADMIARLRGQMGQQDAFTLRIDDWVSRTRGGGSSQISDRLAAEALRAVSRIRTQPNELAELWQEAEEDAAWRQSLDRLEQRLTASLPNKEEPAPKRGRFPWFWR